MRTVIDGTFLLSPVCGWSLEDKAGDAFHCSYAIHCTKTASYRAIDISRAAIEAINIAVAKLEIDK